MVHASSSSSDVSMSLVGFSLISEVEVQDEVSVHSLVLHIDGGKDGVVREVPDVLEEPEHVPDCPPYKKRASCLYRG